MFKLVGASPVPAQMWSGPQVDGDDREISAPEASASTGTPFDSHPYVRTSALSGMDKISSAYLRQLSRKLELPQLACRSSRERRRSFVRVVRRDDRARKGTRY